MRSHTDFRAARLAAALALALCCPAAPALAEVVQSLSLLPADAHLGGRDDELTIPIDIAAAMPMREAVLRLAYSNALAVRPDQSGLDVGLNGTTLVRLPLTATQGISTVELVIPPGIFEIGRNELSLRVRHEHRLGCDRAAYEELWTRVDHERSSLSFDLAPQISSIGRQSIDGLLAASLYDGEPLTIATARAATVLPALAWGASLAEAVALRRGHRPLPVRASRLMPAGAAVTDRVAWATHKGTNLAVIGTVDELGDIIAPGDAALVAGGTVIARRLPADPAHVGLIVTGLDDAAVERALATFRPAIDMATELPVLNGGTAATFADLGVATRELPMGHTASMAVSFGLPPTFYAGAGQYVRLYLNYAYAAGLGATSAMVVRVNGNSANMIRLDRSGGAVITDRDILLSMEFLRPGLNTIELQPLLELADGAECPGDQSMLSLFDDSWIELPPFAELALGGDLKALGSAAFPYAGIPEKASQMVVLGEEPAATGAAWSLRGRLAQMHGGPLPGLSIVQGLPYKPTENLLLVGATPALPESVRGALPLPWSPTASDLPRSPTAGAKTAPGAPAGMAPGSSADSARARWAQRLQTERAPETDSLVGRLLSILPSMAGTRAAAISAGLAVQPTALTEATEPEDLSTGRLFAVRSPFRPDRQLTVLTAESAAELTLATDRLLQPAIWNRLEGDYASWQGSSTAPVTQRLNERFLIGPLEWQPGQLRLAALTFLSSHRSMWIGLLLSSLVLLSLVTSWVLSRRLQP